MSDDRTGKVYEVHLSRDDSGYGVPRISEVSALLPAED